MGLFLRVVGRLLFIAIFALAGFQKITEPSSNAAYLSAAYPNFHKWASTVPGLQLVFNDAKSNVVEQFLQPSSIAENSAKIITSIGILQVVSSVLILASVQLGGVALFLFTGATILIIHNPFVNALNFHAEFSNAVANIALAGIALFIAADVRSTGSSCSSQKQKSPQKSNSSGSQQSSSGKPSTSKSQVSQAPKQKSKK